MMVYKFMILFLKYWIYIFVIYIVIVFFLIYGIRRCVYIRFNKLKRSYEFYIVMEKMRKRIKVFCKIFFFLNFEKKF